MIEKVFTEGTTHTGAHLGFFTGIGALTPVLGKSWELSVKPWLYAPGTFTFGVVLIAASIIMIAFAKRSITAVLKNVGWMLIIPGILAVMFAAFGEERIMGGIHDGISGFAIITPAVDFLIEHSVPHAAYLGLFYILGGVCMLWLSAKLLRFTNYV
jgi:uncharacterized membrane protein HdeD (DUF308 family)